MPLVTTKKMFESAYKNGYAIGEFLPAQESTPTPYICAKWWKRLKK